MPTAALSVQTNCSSTGQGQEYRVEGPEFANGTTGVVSDVHCVGLHCLNSPSDRCPGIFWQESHAFVAACHSRRRRLLLCAGCEFKADDFFCIPENLAITLQRTGTPRLTSTHCRRIYVFALHSRFFEGWNNIRMYQRLSLWISETCLTVWDVK